MVCVRGAHREDRLLEMKLTKRKSQTLISAILFPYSAFIPHRSVSRNSSQAFLHKFAFNFVSQISTPSPFSLSSSSSPPGVGVGVGGGSHPRRTPNSHQMNCQDQGQTPLAGIVEAFEKLAVNLDRSRDDLHLKAFCDACSLVSVLFDSLGIAFKFAEMEYCAKVRSLAEASKRFDTIHVVLDIDVQNKRVKCQGSHSRNLRRVRQGLDLIRALFEQFLSTSELSLREAATTAYAQTCKPYHTWAIRAAVHAGMYALPTRDQLLMKLNETDQSAEKRMRRYMNASLPIIQYIDKLFTNRDITLDW